MNTVGVTKSSLKRNSNVELLRMLCMFFIMFHHFMIHAAFPEYSTDLVHQSEGSLFLAQFLNGFFCVAVNCFVLISGYYGIKFKLRSLFNLYLMCAFYGLAGYLFHLYIEGYHFGRSVIYHTLFVFSHGKWWYISCYVALFFMAPFLNKAIQSLSKKSYVATLALFTVVNVYFGFLWGQSNFNQSGYCVAQFVYLYLIGGYVRRYWRIETIGIRKNRWLITFLVFAVLTGVMAFVYYKCFGNPLKAYYYNNPLVICASVCLLCYALSVKSDCRVVNCMSKNVLAAYLIQCNVYFGYGWLFLKLQDFLVKLNPPILIEWLILAGLSLAFVVASIFIDKIRVWLMRPIWYLYDKIEPEVYNLIGKQISKIDE